MFILPFGSQVGCPLAVSPRGGKAEGVLWDLLRALIPFMRAPSS